MRVIQKNEVQKDVALSLTRHAKNTVTMEDQVNQWTDISKNHEIVKKEKNFKRLITAKIIDIDKSPDRNDKQLRPAKLINVSTVNHTD